MNHTVILGRDIREGMEVRMRSDRPWMMVLGIHAVERNQLVVTTPVGLMSFDKNAEVQKKSQEIPAKP